MSNFPVTVAGQNNLGLNFAPQVVKHHDSVLRYTLNNGNTIALFDMTGFVSFVVSIDNGGQSPNSTFSIQGSNDNSQWTNLQVKSIQTFADIAVGTMTANNSYTMLLGANKTTKYVRVLYSGGNVLHRVNISRSSAPLSLATSDLLHSPDSNISYVATAGGLTTSPVTIFAATPLSFRNLIKSFQATNNGTAFVELSLLDGSGGTDLFRQIIPVGGILNVDFKTAVRTSASNLLQLILTSTAALAVSFNAQGVTINA